MSKVYSRTLTDVSLLSKSLFMLLLKFYILLPNNATEMYILCCSLYVDRVCSIGLVFIDNIVVTVLVLYDVSGRGLRCGVGETIRTTASTSKGTENLFKIICRIRG